MLLVILIPVIVLLLALFPHMLIPMFISVLTLAETPPVLCKLLWVTLIGPAWIPVRMASMVTLSLSSVLITPLIVPMDILPTQLLICVKLIVLVLIKWLRTRLSSVEVIVSLVLPIGKVKLVLKCAPVIHQCLGLLQIKSVYIAVTMQIISCMVMFKPTEHVCSDAQAPLPPHSVEIPLAYVLISALDRSLVTLQIFIGDVLLLAQVSLVDLPTQSINCVF
jgi:hypothetical protein